MTYRAKKPRKQRLMVKLEKAYRISIVDENEKEWAEDLCFGTREDALREGQIMLKETRKFLSDNLDKNPTSCIYWAMNDIGGAKIGGAK